MNELLCTCGALIIEDSIEYANYEPNSEDEYYTGKATCKAGHVTSFTEKGHADSIEDIKDKIRYIYERR